MPAELLRTLVAWLVILPSAFLAGTFYKRLVPQRDPLIRGILYYALGLATLSYGVVALSAVHLLAAPFIWAMLFLPVIVRAHKLGEWLQWLKETGGNLRPGPDLFSRVLFVLFAISFVGLLLGALTPELGGDALCYQLNLPKVFLRQGSLIPDPLDYNSFFPLLMNNLFLIGLATGGVFTAKLFHFFYGFLLFAGIKRFIEIETKNYPLSFFIALVVWVTPTVYNLLSTAYIDVALAFYTFLAVIIFIQALQTGEKKIFLLSGIFLGCAIAVKYIALISAISLFFVWLYSFIASRRLRLHFSGGIVFLLGLAITAGFYLVRNGIVTGNPFFPYWGAVFGQASRPASDVYVYGVGQTWFHYISVYFNMFLSPEFFGTSTTRIGVVYFLLMPFTLLSLLFVPRARGYALFWLSFTTISFFIGQADRWILPVLPVMALAAGYGIHWFYSYASLPLKKSLKLCGGGLAVAILCFYVATGAYHYRYSYLLFTGQWSISKYLTSLERTTEVATWANKNLPTGSKILIDAETRAFYFDHPVVRSIFLEWKTKDPAVLSDPESFSNMLRRNRITHVLTRFSTNEKKNVSAPSSAVEKLLASPFAKKVYDGESRNVRDTRFEYQIFKLTE